MRKKLKFSPAQHRYEIDGKPLTGVTTILGVIAKPALIPWAVKMATEYIKEHAQTEAVYNQELVYQVTEEILKEAGKAHTKKKESAGEIGSQIHNEIEDYVKNGKTSTSSQFLAFHGWWKDQGYEVLESEKQLHSEEHWFAGTVDLILKDKDGKIWIADIKTSSGVYNSYLYQMGGYEIAYCEEYPETKIAGYIIIHITKTGKVDEYVLNSDTIREQAKNAFMSALTLYRAENTINLNK